MKKRVLVVCGTAIATSTHVAARLRDLCRQNGIDADIVQARVQEVPAYVSAADLIVAIAQVPYSVKVPVVSGIPFLTGTGEQHAKDAILTILKKEG